MSCTASATLLSSHLWMKWLFQGKHLGMASTQTSQLHCTYISWIRLAEALACQYRIWPWTDLLVRKKKYRYARENCGRHIVTVHSLHSHWQISPALDSQPLKPISAAARNGLNSVGLSFLRTFPHQHQSQTCRSSWISKSGEYLGA